MSNKHPAVRIPRVSCRRSPTTGAIVAAEFVLCDRIGAQAAAKSEIPAVRLEPFKVPGPLLIIASAPMKADGMLKHTVAQSANV